MSEIANPACGEPEEIEFGNGRNAVVWKDDGRDPGEWPAVLGIRPGRPVIVISGGADTLADAALARAGAMLGPGVAAAAAACGAVVVDGGTSSGVMEIIGAARARRPAAMPVLLGVAPVGQVSYPGGPEGGGRAMLEENHSHFVLADSSEWGGETELLIALAAVLAGDGTPVMLLAGGGPVATADVLEAVRRQWPVFVIQGTGGLADALLGLWAARRQPRRHLAGRLLPGHATSRRAPLPVIEDARLREIIGTGDLRPVTGADPDQLARELSWDLRHEPVLKSAWQEFATYDRLAARLRKAFIRFQASILLLGVTATLLALIYSEVHNRVLHWAVVAIPIVISVLIALASRHAVGQRWVMLRAAAEAIKAEVFRYRTGTAPYGGEEFSSEDHSARQRVLAAHVDAVEAHLMQTEVSSGQLTPYTGALPPGMYGAGREDDGLSPLSAERYLQLRLSDQLAYYRGRVHGLSRRRSLLQLIAIAAGGAGAILAAAGFDIWVGLTGGMAAAALAYMGYLQVDNTIVTYNQTAAKLAGLERQWRALGPGQQNPAAFENLVVNAESTLTNEFAGWVQQMNDAMRELKDRQANAASQIEPADSSHHPPAAAGPGDPPAYPDRG